MKGSIVKKGSTYFCVYWINGKQKWVKGGPTRKLAEKVLRDILHDVDNGTYKELKEIGFTDYAKSWLESYAKVKVKPSTLESYKYIAEKNLIPHFENTKLISISPISIQGYVSKRVKEVKPKTVGNEIILLKEMFKHAVIWGYLKENPAQFIEKPRVEKEEMDILTPEEIRAFLVEITPRHYVFFLMAVTTGARRGELLGLQKGDISWNTNQIHVRRAMWKGRFVTPKSKYSIRSIDMTPYLAHELKKHLLSTPLSKMDLVFCNKEGKPLDANALVRRHFLPALRRAGLRRIPFHSLRHSNTALRIAEGQNIKYIQRQLGHASIQTTLDRYGHLLTDVNYEAAKKLDSILGFETPSKRDVLEKC